MNLSRLRFVKAAAAECSFSRAAEQCSVTQPTLSNGIAQLEEEFGGKLFSRTTRKVSLTPFGEQILPLVEAVLQAQGELEAGVKSYYDPQHQILRIGLSPLIDTRLLAQILEPYRADHPDTDIFFKECFLGDLSDRLQKGQIDIMLRPHLTGSAPHRGLNKAVFYEEDFYYLPKQAGLSSNAEGGAVQLRAVANETFILSHDGCGLATATRKLFTDAGIKLKEYSGQTMSYQVMQEWADLGIGATILPRSRLSPDYRDKAQRLLITAKRPARIKVEAYWDKAPAYPKHIAAFHQHIMKRVPKLVQGASAIAD